MVAWRSVVFPHPPRVLEEAEVHDRVVRAQPWNRLPHLDSESGGVGGGVWCVRKYESSLSVVVVVVALVLDPGLVDLSHHSLFSFFFFAFFFSFSLP